MQPCPICPRTHRCVRGHGPKNVSVMCIGERPGYSEDFGGLPFIGQSGAEFNDNYLRLASLTRNLADDPPRPNLPSDIYLTNTVKCRNANSNIKPSKKEVEVCGQHWLPTEVREADPSVIVLMGAVPCSMMPRHIDMEKEHGIPFWLDKCEFFGDWEGWVVPMYHPAAGMHNTALMIPLLEDWENLGAWLKGKWQLPTPVREVTRMVRLQTADEVFAAIHRRHPFNYPFLPTDTESDESRPFSIQFSPNPQEGYMILEQDREAIETFGTHLAFEWNNRMAMHFALHDLDELERHYGWAGIEVVDTMIDAYHLGNLPQKLKFLTYRLTGIHMTSYDEVVVPASKDALSDWLANAIAFVGSDWQMERTKQLKTRLKVEFVKHPAEAVLRRVLRFCSDSESDYDPWQQPKKLGTEDEEVRLLGRDWLEALEGRVGRMPRKSIVHAPLAKAIEYGCSDAIYTGHCMVRLAERRVEQQKKWAVDKEDWDQ